jgi:hypothetical protein
VQIGAADAGAIDADEHVVDPGDGLGHVFEPEARSGVALDGSFPEGTPRRRLLPALIRPARGHNRERFL